MLRTCTGLERPLHGHRVEVNRGRGTGKRLSTALNYRRQGLNQGLCKLMERGREAFGFGCGDRGSHTGSHRHYRVQNSPSHFSYHSSSFRPALRNNTNPAPGWRKITITGLPALFSRVACLDSNPSTHRRKSTCSDARWPGLGFSTSVRHPDARLLPYPKRKKFPSW